MVDPGVLFFLEKKFELVEKALFRGAQKQDETSDSYLSRVDVILDVTELLAKGADLKDIQSYIALRGSRIASDDKKIQETCHLGIRCRIWWGAGVVKVQGRYPKGTRDSKPMTTQPSQWRKQVRKTNRKPSGSKRS